MTALNPYWEVKVSGLENIDRHKVYVVASNHQSLADIVLMYKTKMQFKWVAKEELLKVPFIGGLLWVNNHILVSRGRLGSIKEVYQKAAEYLKSGTSMLFFPEGTRAGSDEMSPFKNGAFKLAIKEKVPVLPILISGTKDIIPKGGRQFSTKIFCTLRVFPAVETSSLGPGDFDRLKNGIRSTIVSGLAQC